MQGNWKLGGGWRSGREFAISGRRRRRNGGIALILSCSLKRIEENGARGGEDGSGKKWKEKGEELIFIWRTGDLKCKSGGKDERRATGPVVTAAEDMGCQRTGELREAVSAGVASE